MLFIIVFIKIDKDKKLKPYQVGESIAFMPFNKFFNYLSYIDKDFIWWLINIKNLIYKKTRGLYIQTEKKYIIFTNIINKLDVKKQST